MKAVVKYDYGPNKTEIRDVPVPEIGDDDILMEVKAAAVCGSDVGFDSGAQEGGLHCPVILGHEFSGVVAKVGKNVSEWKVGERIVSDNTGKVCGKCHACETGQYLLCTERLGLGYGMDGGFTKYVRIPGEIMKIFPGCVFHIPESMSFEEAAMMDPVSNAYRAVVQDGCIKAGETVAVFGVGPIGLFCVQVAHAAGAAKIIAIGLTADKEALELAKKFGATHTLMSDVDDVIAEVNKITDGEGVALSVDAAGAPVCVKIAIEITRPLGNLVRIAYNPAPLGFPLNRLVDKAIQLKGHFGYDWVSWKNCFALIEAGKIDMKSLISHRMSILQFREAIDLMKQRKATKIILYPED